MSLDEINDDMIRDRVKAIDELFKFIEFCETNNISPVVVLEVFSTVIGQVIRACCKDDDLSLELVIAQIKDSTYGSDIFVKKFKQKHQEKFEEFKKTLENN